MNNTEALKLLIKLCKIPTVASREKEAADVLQEMLEGYGVACRQVEYAPGRSQLVATLGEGGPVLGLSGHLDVVPVGEIPWHSEPFAPEVRDGNLYGRGTTDMKAGVVALAAAMVRIKQKGTPLNGQIKLLCTVGEEHGAVGADQLTQLGELNDVDALLIGEPSCLQVVTAHKGALWLRLTTYGKTAHGSLPAQGVNAVEHMVDVLNIFRQRYPSIAKGDGFVGDSSYSIDVIGGGSSTNVIPDKCSCEIDMRTVSSQNHSEMVAEIKAWVAKLSEETPNLRCEVEVINNLQPVNTDRTDAFVKLCKRAAEDVTGAPVEIAPMTAYTDAAQFVLAEKSFPIVIQGPGDMAVAHKPDEFVPVEEFYKAIELFEKIACDYLA